MKYKMTVQYDGSRYKGWQSQKKTDATIQGKLSAVLEQFAGEPVDIQGSGRTDAGVHAMGQVASFELKRDCTPGEIMDYVNHYLPEDIGVIKVEEAQPRFHARLNADSKTYVYRIWNSKKPNVFERKWMYTIEEPLQLTAMRQGAFYVLGTHDFAAFCAFGKKKKSTVRTIYALDVEAAGEEVRISVTGNGFLHHMVRILVGTLVEIGLGRRKPEEMLSILESGNRENAGVTMPAKGLILWQVTYPNTVRQAAAQNAVEEENTQRNENKDGKMDGNGEKSRF